MPRRERHDTISFFVEPANAMYCAQLLPQLQALLSKTKDVGNVQVACRPSTHHACPMRTRTVLTPYAHHAPPTHTTHTSASPQVRLSIGCAHNVLLPTAPAEGAPPWERAAYNAARAADPSEGLPATVCQLFAEVSLALEPPRLQPYASRLQPCALEVAALYPTPPLPPRIPAAPFPLRVTGASRPRTKQDGGVGAPGAAGQPVAGQGV